MLYGLERTALRARTTRNCFGRSTLLTNLRETLACVLAPAEMETVRGSGTGTGRGAEGFGLRTGKDVATMSKVLLYMWGYFIPTGNGKNRIFWDACHFQVSFRESSDGSVVLEACIG